MQFFLFLVRLGKWFSIHLSPNSRHLVVWRHLQWSNLRDAYECPVQQRSGTLLRILNALARTLLTEDIKNNNCSHAQSYMTLCNPMDLSPGGFSVHGITLAGAVEQVAIYFSRGSSQPKDQTCISSQPSLIPFSNRVTIMGLNFLIGQLVKNPPAMQETWV